jgi:hypothetical protein
LPGQNIQSWLRKTFVENYPNCRNYMGEDCSIAEDTEDLLFGWSYDNPESMTIARAITVCRHYIRPVKLPKEFRGDWEYQHAHKVTNLKRKMAWFQQNEGSCYDSDEEWSREWASLESNFPC